MMFVKCWMRIILKKLFIEIKNMTTENPSVKELQIKCACRNEILSLEKWSDEDEYYLVIYRYSFRNENTDGSFLTRLKNAIRSASRAFRGIGIETADVIISGEDFEKIREF